MTKLLAFVCYWTGIDRLFYLLNRKAKRIITFHNVIPQKLLPQGMKIGITDDVRSFSTIISEIRKKYRINNDINDTSTATITFDDGYKNQVEVAGKILREMGNIPAIIFASGQNINNTDPNNALVVDLLLHWTFLAECGEYHINDTKFILSENNRDAVWSNTIWPAFCADSLTKGKQLLAILDSLYSMKDILGQCSDEYLRLRLTGISEDDITNHKSQRIDVGWHTQSHFPLSHLSTDEKKSEIDCPYSYMKQLPFSYPYGENESVDDEAKGISKQIGYPCAVSNIIEQNYDRFFLPRMALPSNKYLLHFELSGLKYFIQNRKLLH